MPSPSVSSNEKLITAVARSMGEGAYYTDITTSTIASGNEGHVSVAAVSPVIRVTTPAAGTQLLSLQPGFYPGHEVILIVGTDGGHSTLGCTLVGDSADSSITLGNDTGNFTQCVWNGSQWLVALKNF